MAVMAGRQRGSAAGRQRGSAAAARLALSRQRALRQRASFSLQGSRAAAWQRGSAAGAGAGVQAIAPAGN
eukprot:5935398-Prymnesium_polylepis.1